MLKNLLLKIKSAKEAIKQAILNKGGTITGGFNTYAESINKLELPSNDLQIYDDLSIPVQTVTTITKVPQDIKEMFKDATQMISTFSNCRSLTSLELQEGDLQKLNYLSSAFYMCQKLSLSKLVLPNVTYMYNNFQYCSLIKDIELDIPNALYFNEAYASYITKLTLKNTNNLQRIVLTGNISTLEIDSFSNVTLLDFKNLKITSLNLENAINIHHLTLVSLTALNDLILPSVIEMQSETGYCQISGCSNLTKLSLPGNTVLMTPNFTNANMTYTISNCTRLQTIDFLEPLNYGIISLNCYGTNTNSYSTKLTEINLSDINASAIRFYGSGLYSIKKLTVKSIGTNVTSFYLYDLYYAYTSNYILDILNKLPDHSGSSIPHTFTFPRNYTPPASVISILDSKGWSY